MPDAATTPGEAPGPVNPQDRTTGRPKIRSLIHYLWDPTPLEQRGYDWMNQHHVFVNVVLGIAFPPYGLVLLILWMRYGYDKENR